MSGVSFTFRQGTGGEITEDSDPAGVRELRDMATRWLDARADRTARALATTTELNDDLMARALGRRP